LAARRFQQAGEVTTTGAVVQPGAEQDDAGIRPDDAGYGLANAGSLESGQSHELFPRNAGTKRQVDYMFRPKKVSSFSS